MEDHSCIVEIDLAQVVMELQWMDKFNWKNHFLLKLFGVALKYNFLSNSRDNISYDMIEGVIKNIINVIIWNV